MIREVKNSLKVTLIHRSYCSPAIKSEEHAEAHKGTTTLGNEVKKATVAWPHIIFTKGMGAPVVTHNKEVHPEVAEILQKSKPQKMGRTWHKPKISARRLAMLRKQYIAQGYYWPDKPMVDRGLDRLPKGHKYEKQKEERLAQIEENMKNMPRIIEDYRSRMGELRAKRREEKKQAKLKAIEAQRLGFNLRDPRALQMLDGNKKGKKKP